VVDRGSWLLWVLAPAAVAVASLGLASLPREQSIGDYVTPLEGRTPAQRHNARMSVEKLNGAVIQPFETFSFNGRIGTYSRDAGYRKAPVSYNGQLIDDWGGGVCQTSSTLYNAALLAGMEIVERHKHQFQPKYVPPGRDAAVAFSNIDLRFRNPHPFPVRIRASLDAGMLRVEMLGSAPLKERPEVYSDVQSAQQPWEIQMGGSRRVRNSGKTGWEVAVYRLTGKTRELISHDTYPVMHRVLE
jgi:vancomycin resistance protein VanW